MVRGHPGELGEKQKLIISAAVSSKWLERRQASRRLWVRVPYCRGKIAYAVEGSGKCSNLINWAVANVLFSEVELYGDSRS